VERDRDDADFDAPPDFALLDDRDALDAERPPRFGWLLRRCSAMPSFLLSRCGASRRGLSQA